MITGLCKGQLAGIETGGLTSFVPFLQRVLMACLWIFILPFLLIPLIMSAVTIKREQLSIREAFGAFGVPSILLIIVVSLLHAFQMRKEYPYILQSVPLPEAVAFWVLVLGLCGIFIVAGVVGILGGIVLGFLLIGAFIEVPEGQPSPHILLQVDDRMALQENLDEKPDAQILQQVEDYFQEADFAHYR